MEMQQQGTSHILFQLSSSISAWLAHIPGKQQEHLFQKILQLPRNAEDNNWRQLQPLRETGDGWGTRWRAQGLRFWEVLCQVVNLQLCILIPRVSLHKGYTSLEKV